MRQIASSLHKHDLKWDDSLGVGNICRQHLALSPRQPCGRVLWTKLQFFELPSSSGLQTTSPNLSSRRVREPARPHRFIVSLAYCSAVKFGNTPPFQSRAPGPASPISLYVEDHFPCSGRQVAFVRCLPFCKVKGLHWANRGTLCVHSAHPKSPSNRLFCWFYTLFQ